MKRKDIATFITILTACITLTACGATNDETVEVTEPATAEEETSDIETSETIESIIEDIVEETSESEFSIEVSIEAETEESTEVSTAELEESAESVESVAEPVEEVAEETVSVEVPVAQSETTIPVETVTPEVPVQQAATQNNTGIVLRPHPTGYGYTYDYNGVTYEVSPSAYVGADDLVYKVNNSKSVLYGTPGTIEAEYMSEADIQLVKNIIPKYMEYANAVLHNSSVNPFPQFQSDEGFKIDKEMYVLSSGIPNVTIAVGNVTYWSSVRIYADYGYDDNDGIAKPFIGFDLNLVDPVSGLTFVLPGGVWPDGTTLNTVELGCW